MGSYTIGQVAERSGFSATALRYYEGIGLVTPAARTDAGYRLYDDQTLARLTFIARAKQLGCTLEETTELVDIWTGDHCAPVQRRMHELVTAKVRDAETYIADLTAFTTQLRSVAAQLNGEPVDGPCDDGCACLHDPPNDGAVPLGTDPTEPPIACTLDLGALPDRLAEWDAVIADTRQRSVSPSGRLRIEFSDRVDVAELARLAAAEQQCCAFFRFAITVDTRGIGLEIDAPADAQDLVTAVFAPS